MWCIGFIYKGIPLPQEVYDELRETDGVDIPIRYDEGESYGKKFIA